MSLKSQKSNRNLRPVSQKAYATFVMRITAVMPDSASVAAMIFALDCYLAGDYAAFIAALDDKMHMVFSILRFDIDKAKERSARARNRRRRPAAEKQTVGVRSKNDDSKIAEPPVSSDVQDYEPGAEQQPVGPQSSRRSRRKDERAKRIKYRWRRIG